MTPFLFGPQWVNRLGPSNQSAMAELQYKHKKIDPFIAGRKCQYIYCWSSGDHLNVRILSYQYRDPHVKDKTAFRPSYL